MNDSRNRAYTALHELGSSHGLRRGAGRRHDDANRDFAAAHGDAAALGRSLCSLYGDAAPDARIPRKESRAGAGNGSARAFRAEINMAHKKADVRLMIQQMLDDPDATRW